MHGERATAPVLLWSTYRNCPSGLSRASTAPTLVPRTGVLPRCSAPPGAIEYRDTVPYAVFTVNGNRPSWVISTQHGAVWLSANGEDPIEVSVPPAESRNAETVPEPAPVLWAHGRIAWTLPASVDLCLGEALRGLIVAGALPGQIAGWTAAGTAVPAGGQGIK